MRHRRLAALIACVLLLHLQFGGAVRYCTNAPANEQTDRVETASDPHAHHGSGGDTSPHQDESTESDHCALMAMCTLLLTTDVMVAGVVAANVMHQPAFSPRGTQPVSRSTVPDSPPPKI